MNAIASVSALLKQYKIAVVIPTYNNDKTLCKVINGVLDYTSDIVVINDGSTDHTADLLREYTDLHCIHLSKNKGKGHALNLGFKAAKLLGFKYVITLDSDGQHFPEDLAVFAEALHNSPTDVLLIGSRDMDQAGVPRKSNFGNKFSNFWFWFETGIRLVDTQSGYRLYPLDRLPKRLYTPKFEFEIEVIVRTAWKGVPVKNIPVKIYYQPENRVTHFRPLTDFTRISILNTALVVIALLYIIPRNFIRKFKKKSFKDFVREDILGSEDSNKKKALSIALGVFIGIAPLWGLQMFLSIFLAVAFRLNKALSFTFSNISIPPMIPPIIFASLEVGAFFIPRRSTHLSLENINFEVLYAHLTQYIVGSLVLATATACVFGFGSYVLLSIYKK